MTATHVLLDNDADNNYDDTTRQHVHRVYTGTVKVRRGPITGNHSFTNIDF